MEKTMISNSREETFQIGAQLGRALTGGEIICLYGDLGAGKTVLAKGIGQGLNIADEITSPTFTLIQEYPLNRSPHLTFVHMDLYRLNHLDEAEVIGVPEYFREDCICLIEWPQIIEELLPDDRINIRISGSGDLPRTIKISLLSFYG